MQKHYIYITAGFFGFSNLGGITYFHHVREVLEELLLEAGIEAEIHYVPTLPTASIRRRAGLLLKEVAETTMDPGAPIHLIGHSTGGLDARLFVTPSASISKEYDLEAYASRVKSVVTVATPHLGTPMASFFNTLFGQSILSALSLGTIYTLQFGKLPLSALFVLLGVITRVDVKLGLKNSVLEQFYRELFSDFDATRQAAIREFLDEVRSDRAVVGQLTPGAIDLFNASTADRPTVNYGCVVTRATRFSVRAQARLGLDAYAQASNAVYRALYVLTSRNPQGPPATRDQELALVRNLGELPSRRDNDGIVPTLSQLWGRVIHVTQADHLDVCGHFNDPGHKPPHVDWFISGSGFTRQRFEELWADVAAFIVESSA